MQNYKSLKKPKSILKISLIALVIILIFSSLFVASCSKINAHARATIGTGIGSIIGNSIGSSIGKGAKGLPTNPTNTSGNTYRYAVDRDGNRLMYLPSQGNMVFTSSGIAVSGNGELITYNPSTEQFQDGLRRRVELVETTLQGATHYVVQFGNYSVISINFDDNLYLVRLRANTNFNRGARREILLRRVWVRNTGFWGFLQGMAGNHGRFYYADIFGNIISNNYLEQPTGFNASLFIVGIGTGNLVGGVRVPRWGTIRDLLVEIRFLVDIGVLDPPDDSGTIADGLHYNLGGRVRIRPTGQLSDTLNYPLICNRARPLIFYEDEGVYKDFFGGVLNIRSENNRHYLIDTSGAKLRSIMYYLDQEGQDNRLYFVWIYFGEVIVQIPARARNTSNFFRPSMNLRFYDMNGVRLCNRDYFIQPIEHPATESDRRQNWPEEFGFNIFTLLAIIAVVLVIGLILMILSFFFPVVGIVLKILLGFIIFPFRMIGRLFSKGGN